MAGSLPAMPRAFAPTITLLLIVGSIPSFHARKDIRGFHIPVQTFYATENPGFAGKIGSESTH